MRVKVVCVTCDLYSRLIPGFCHFLEENWPDRPWELEIVAGTEQPCFGGLPHKFWFYGPDRLWASNVLAYLRQTDAKIVVLLLDDYYVCEPVDDDLMTKYVGMMQADASIGYINLRPWGSDVLDGRELMEWRITAEVPLAGEYDKAAAEYLLSLQPGIWRVDFLTSLLVEGEDHWQTERRGTTRARSSNKRMLACLVDFPLHYCNITRYGTWRDGSRGWLEGQLGQGHGVVRMLDDMLKERVGVRR